MKTIWKFVIPPAGNRKSVEMPAGALVLSAAFQGEDLCVWALVDPDARKERRGFAVLATGEKMPIATGFKFISTGFIHGLVFHIFETT